MIDSSHIKLHPDGTGARGGNQAVGRTKGAEQQTAPGGGFPWDAGTDDPDLFADVAAQYLLADRGYDSDAVVVQAAWQGMEAVIPPRGHRQKPRDYGRALYKLRHLVENALLTFKQWRGVATRYAKNEASFLAICQIRAMAMWTRLF